MAGMKEVYIIICVNSNGALHVKKKFGTREEIQDYIDHIINIDAENDMENFISGTNSVDELEYIGDRNGIYGYNIFFNCEIDYYAYPVNDIPNAEED